jgi:hypothetical protein
MSETTTEALLPTAANFDAIVAANEAKLTAAEVPDESSDAGIESADSSVDASIDADAAGIDGDGDGDGAETAEAEVVADAEPVADTLLAAAKAEGRITPELLKEIGDLTIEVQLAGGPKEVPVKELANGYMRQAHFQRSMEKANAKERQAEQIFEIERARTNSWQREPGQLYNGLLAMGCEATLEKVFEYMVEERHAYLTASPSERARIDQIKQMQKQQALMQQRAAELERQAKAAQAQQPTEVDEGTAAAYRYIEANMDRALGSAFKAANVGKVTPYALQLFESELMGYAKMGLSVEEAVNQAASAVADRFVEIKQAAGTMQQKQLPPKAAPAGKVPPRDKTTGQFTTQPTKKAAKAPPTAAEFAKRFGI